MYALPAHKQDMKQYNADMRAGLGSKLFFLEHIPLEDIKEFVDFGCGDGSLLKAIHGVVPEAALIGIDKDEGQARRAEKNLAGTSHGSFITTEHFWGSEALDQPACLIFSSVLHEVFTPQHVNPKAWWHRIERYDYDYIVVRDFAVKEETLEGWRLYHRKCCEVRDWAIFERYNLFGDHPTSPFEFLLKYTYTDNWEREVAEHYLRLSYEEWLQMVTASGLYEVIHHRGTRTKKFEQDMQRDFGFMPDFTTHIEMVLRRRR